ncbi:MAG: bifunctional pyr operon transcriptional regulator/uracil phosphoribosyltransferase PyrR [Eubacteriales bacterium]|nr:bifunctional pyr operon transcriptional regulator/uracil phosphoribosyltransferase PyrR [Eubacteriales bacterium]
MTGGIPKAQLMAGDAMNRALIRMAHEMMEQLDPLEDVVFVGIRRRGVPLAQRLADIIAKYEQVKLPVGEVDIAMYRDDRDPGDLQIAVQGKNLPVDVTGKIVVLVDDVLHTGRTVRAAMDAILDQGRPAKIRLAVLIDRGHRELPIRPDFVGKNVPTSQNERIGVQMEEIDGGDGVELYEGRRNR